MPIPASAVDTEALKAALLAKGALADRGRYSPFAGIAEPVNDGSSSVTPGAPVSLNTALAGNAAGEVGPSSPASPAANTPDTTLPVDDKTLDGLDEGSAIGLLSALGLGGAALAAYLMRRRQKLASPPTEDVPLVEGEVIPPKPRATGDKIVDGEVVETTKEIGNLKRLPQGATTPNNEGMKALGAPKEVNVPRVGETVSTRPPSKKTLTEQMLARAGRTEPNDVETVHLNDSLSDLTPAEKEQATTLVQQLKANRVAGNKIQIQRKYGNRKIRTTLPSGDVDENSLMGIVVRMIREGKMKPGMLSRVIP
ncbi:MAG TPA: hypothetical protein VLG09_04100 [Candidatus Saccharimonadales bacterium]|nr:hypothetical protein [Candidatus Saccharimonadales bacterium]